MIGQRTRTLSSCFDFAFPMLAGYVVRIFKSNSLAFVVVAFGSFDSKLAIETMITATKE